MVTGFSGLVFIIALTLFGTRLNGELRLRFRRRTGARSVAKALRTFVKRENVHQAAIALRERPQVPSQPMRSETERSDLLSRIAKIKARRAEMDGAPSQATEPKQPKGGAPQPGGCAVEPIAAWERFLALRSALVRADFSVQQHKAS